jgi:hypothetical protein
MSGGRFNERKIAHFLLEKERGHQHQSTVALDRGSGSYHFGRSYNPAAPQDEAKSGQRSQLLNSLNSYHLVSFFSPTAVADALGEGDKVVVGLVA